MSDDKETVVTDSQPIPIDLNDAAAVQHWAKTLGVAPEELVAAAKASAPTVQAVTAQLARRSAAGPSS
jgi:hypothetical protein